MSIEKDNEKDSLLEEKFFAAVKIIQNLPKEGPISTSNNIKLSFYSLYKQSTIGPCDQEQPSFWNVVEKYKWDAWNKLGLMNKETAMIKYLDLFNKQIDDIVNNYGVDYFINLEKEFNLEGILEPAFKKLGRSIRNPILVECQINTFPMVNDEIQIIEDEVKSNDGDYIDANEDTQFGSITKTQSLSTEIKTPPDDTIKLFTKTFSNFINLLERKASTLSSDVINLTNKVIEQNNIIKKILMDKEKDKCNKKIIENPISWKVVFFLFIWPFLVHYILKYWKFIKILFSMYFEW
ncbi:Acyl-CoA-binding protein, ACBP domain and FERM/acyl-CoA-binding protein, 3-helical bundle domain-containing protein [Strongyloides ratti]|uniref:Acyl-CoA-binding protein, ACBP domain and FERM/acyl-CoA-binding protein, 3-helical bundle domain-containing protein n=1 Tax=Strongyloides ratti TaxID=34506 RepID=A0A090LAS5_STRRB|nr:Acyl-CoA-binding protein, ACBP domain and FERM/acyl-CoA-binding protein, 3-helical bundle domain-containing protein [Strongyloides ratti]CEF66896.1 Acyl-CoA-binding protein, ACBP domain and FERM/acyl-CoA-binding protein, 3-helical bundle domain-containing protein [Strongyloides ratti]